MRLPVELRYPALWPMWCWYAWVVVQALLIGLIAASINWLVRGEFWEPFAYGFGGPLVGGFVGLCWVHYRHARKRRRRTR